MPAPVQKWVLNIVCSEIVGLSAALKMGFELLRPWGKELLAVLPGRY